MKKALLTKQQGFETTGACAPAAVITR